MRFFAFIFFLLLGFSCVRHNKIPEGILSQNEMHKVMWDLMRADAYLFNFVQTDSTRDVKKETAILYEKVFAIHATTQETFRKSMVFYESRPDLFKPISDSLKSDEKRVQEIRDYDKRPRTPDSSIRKAKQPIKVLDKQ